MMVDSGSNNVVLQRSFLTFTNSLIQVINGSQTGCTLASTLTPDLATFDMVFQNRVCNGNAPCNLGGVTVPPASIAYESGVSSNPPAQGDFRVGRVTFCANNVGDALIHWEFNWPVRYCEIPDEYYNTVSNPSFYSDYVIHVVP